MLEERMRARSNARTHGNAAAVEKEAATCAAAEAAAAASHLDDRGDLSGCGDDSSGCGELGKAARQDGGGDYCFRGRSEADERSTLALLDNLLSGGGEEFAFGGIRKGGGPTVMALRAPWQTPNAGPVEPDLKEIVDKMCKLDTRRKLAF